MIQIDFITLASQMGLPAIGGFIGSWVALLVSCPNRGCCRAAKVKAVLEE